MKNLRQYSTEELKEELERREMEPKPQLLPSANFSYVIKLCEQYINNLDQNGWVDDDLEHYIFEAAMKAVYGSDVFDWVNEQR